MYGRARTLRHSLITAGLVAMLCPGLSAAQTPEDPSPNAPQPPTGYYPPQPGYSAPPAAIPGAEPAYHQGFLAMPFIGAHIPTGDFGDAYDPGLRLGTLLGGHISPALSLNGELAIDILNPAHVPSGADVTAVMVDMLFSPLLHFGSEAFEGFIGPKLGFFGLSASISYRGQEIEGSAQGLAYGFNAGMGVPIGKLAVGILFGYVGRHALRSCTKQSGASEKCTDNPEGDDVHAFSFSGMVLF